MDLEHCSGWTSLCDQNYQFYTKIVATLRDRSLKEFTAPVSNGNWTVTGILNKIVF
jgi:hypothetical protein